MPLAASVSVAAAVAAQNVVTNVAGVRSGDAVVNGVASVANSAQATAAASATVVPSPANRFSPQWPSQKRRD